MRISDCSSDVCSSDLFIASQPKVVDLPARREYLGEREILISSANSGMSHQHHCRQLCTLFKLRRVNGVTLSVGVAGLHHQITRFRSEEARVGKEWVGTVQSRWSPCH